MTKTNFGKNTQSQSGCDAETVKVGAGLGQAATTAADLPAESIEKKGAIPTSQQVSSGENAPKMPSDSVARTLDPVCGMFVDESTDFHVERDGKSYYFCSDRCRQSFLAVDPATQSKS